MKPTDEQIKEVWEWCGCKIVKNQHFISIDVFYFDIVFPDGKEIRVDELSDSIDLNNLFKYAVPKVEQIELVTKRASSIPNFVPDGYRASASIGALEYHYGDKDPALALFWAIWEVMHEKAT